MKKNLNENQKDFLLTVFLSLTAAGSFILFSWSVNNYLKQDLLLNKESLELEKSQKMRSKSFKSSLLKINQSPQKRFYKFYSKERQKE